MVAINSKIKFLDANRGVQQTDLTDVYETYKNTVMRDRDMCFSAITLECIGICKSLLLIDHFQNH